MQLSNNELSLLEKGVTPSRLKNAFRSRSVEMTFEDIERTFCVTLTCTGPGDGIHPWLMQAISPLLLEAEQPLVGSVIPGNRTVSVRHRALKVIAPHLPELTFSVEMTLHELTLATQIVGNTSVAFLRAEDVPAHLHQHLDALYATLSEAATKAEIHSRDEAASEESA